MIAQHSTAFREAVANTLERFAFTFDHSEEEGSFDGLPEDYVYVEMSFSGIAEGSASLAASVSLCHLLASNTMGVDIVGVNVEDMEDAMKEMLNIVCGQLTCTIFGGAPVFELSIPSIRHIDQGKWREFVAGDDILRFWVEDKPLLGRLMVTDEGIGA